MGFFLHLKLVKLFKNGIKAAMQGDLDQAIEYFDEAFFLSHESCDLKTQSENMTWYYLCLTIKLIKEGKLNEARQSYNEFNIAHQTYVDACNMTPGIGTRTRYFAWENQIKDFIKVYSVDINNLREKL